MNQPILVTAPARSRTSMTAELIHNAGAFGGDVLLSRGYANPRGFFENLEIRQKIAKPMLAHLKCDPKGQKPLPNDEQIEAMKMDRVLATRLRSRVLGVMREQGFLHGPWYYKGAKMLLVWPAWHRAFPDAKWVYVWRSDEGIINSCLRTHFMQAYKDAAGWKGWIEHHKKRLGGLMASGADVHVFDGDLATSGDFEEVRKMLDFCGLPYSRSKADEIIIRGKNGGKSNSG